MAADNCHVRPNGVQWNASVEKNLQHLQLRPAGRKVSSSMAAKHVRPSSPISQMSGLLEGVQKGSWPRARRRSAASSAPQHSAPAGVCPRARAPTTWTRIHSVTPGLDPYPYPETASNQLVSLRGAC